MPERFSSRLPLIVLAGALLTAFHRLLLGEVFFWGLPSLQFYPWREYGFDLLRNGQLPLWNPYNGLGAPLLANYQSAFLYPLNWLGLILPLAWQMSVTAVLHLFIAGWGMWLFTGRLGLPELGRGISALAFGMTGYLVARLGTYPTISAAAWMPWLLWAALGVLTRKQRRDMGWLAVFAGLQLLAGHAQTTWYSMLLVGVFSAWWSVTHRPFNWRRLMFVVLALMLGAGIAAAQLIPTAELLRQSQRSTGVDFDFAMNFSYSLPRTLNLLSPNVFGNPGDGSYITEEGAFFEDAVYIGLIPLISALVAMLTWVWGKLRQSERPIYFAHVPFWLLIVMIAYLFALGKDSPIFPFLYRNIPTFSLFQAPVRWHIWTVFGLSVLAGIGVGMWGRGYWLFFSTRLATAGCIGAALLALIAPRFLPPDVSSIEGVQVIIQAVVTTGILGALAGALTLLQPEAPTGNRYRWWITAVWVVLAGDLIYAAQGLNPTISASFYDRLQPANTAVERAYWLEAAEEDVKFGTFLLFNDYQVAVDNADAFRKSGLSNLNLLDRTPLLNNFEPLLVGSFAEYVDLIEANPDQRDTLLQAAGVTGIYDTDGTLQKLERGVRAWVVESACWHSDKESLIAAILEPTWNPARQVHLLGEGDCPTPPAEASAVGEVLTFEDASNNVNVQLQVEGEGWLVLADTFYPGWAASDGNASQYDMYSANLAMRAVQVNPSVNTVSFSYQPWWLWPGVLVSLVSLLITLVLFRSRNPDTE
ncbi:MAG: YfhO family protein [Anaerolineae bacterium]|nr:YfhO family protein [Anaerolineae bacterium]